MIYSDEHQEFRVPVRNTIGEIGRGFQQQMTQFVMERMFASYSVPITCAIELEATRDTGLLSIGGGADEVMLRVLSMMDGD